METYKIILIILVFFGFLFLANTIKDSLSEMKTQCEVRNITDNCNYATIRCNDDCIDFGQQYLRYSDGGFADEECWCKLNNESKQIW